MFQAADLAVIPACEDDSGMDSQVGLSRGEVKLVSHQSWWKRAYEEERDRLRLLLSHLAIDIQHVGSTAVPGLCAKPVIDVLVGLVSRDEFGSARNLLVEAGYEDRGQREPGRLHFAKGSSEYRTHYVHLVAHSSPEWCEKLIFRDYLIAHPVHAQAYERLKRELASRYAAERKAYTAAKFAFVRETLALAAVDTES